MNNGHNGVHAIQILRLSQWATIDTTFLLANAKLSIVFVIAESRRNRKVIYCLLAAFGE